MKVEIRFCYQGRKSFLKTGEQIQAEVIRITAAGGDQNILYRRPDRWNLHLELAAQWCIGSTKQRLTSSFVGSLIGRKHILRDDIIINDQIYRIIKELQIIQVSYGADAGNSLQIRLCYKIGIDKK